MKLTIISYMAWLVTSGATREERKGYLLEHHPEWRAAGAMDILDSSGLSLIHI